MRRWSVVLWVAAAALGFWLTLRKAPPLHVLVMVSAPSAEAVLQQDVVEAVESEAGHQGLSPELRVYPRTSDRDDDLQELRRLGFPVGKGVVCGVVESDAKDCAVRLVRMFPVASKDEANRVARDAVATAREWADR